MPVYVFECKECGKRFEILQGINEPPMKKCECCPGDVTKVFTPIGIVFKGSGFYATDSKKGSSTNGMSAPSKPAETKESSETKESKETKTEKADAPVAKAAAE